MCAVACANDFVAHRQHARAVTPHAIVTTSTSAKIKGNIPASPARNPGKNSVTSRRTNIVTDVTSMNAAGNNVYHTGRRRCTNHVVATTNANAASN